MESSAVMATNDDASQCKRYAVHMGYWKDDYISNFVKKLPDRKSPEINRGYYMRYRAVRNIVNQFLNLTNSKCQIISLGAGFDTLFWNLYKVGSMPKYGFYEIDLTQVVQRKCMLIKSNKSLADCLRNISFESQNRWLKSDVYHLISVDITNVDDLRSHLKDAGIQFDLPTLFIAECVFVYLSPADTQKLLELVGNEFKTVLFLDYDPVNFDDRFGDVMKQNMRGRNCHLLGAQPTLSSKLSLFNSFTKVHAKLLYDVYIELPIDERKRIENIEFLDEIDLLFDLLRHYSVCLAVNDTEGFGFNDVTL